MKPKFFDFIRWPFALAVLYLITHFSIIGVFYAFEFIVRLFITFKLVFYVLLIIPSILLLSFIVYAILFVIYKILIVILVRQIKSLSVVFIIVFSISIIVFLILFWTGYIEFSWESLRLDNLNKTIFSLLFLSFLFIPFIIYLSLINYLAAELRGIKTA